MALIKWRDSYSVGIEKLDKEHLKLVELVNDMYIIVRDKGDIVALNSCIERVVEYTQFHFYSEEVAMEEKNFPGLDEHKKIHNDLVVQVIAFVERVKIEGEELRAEFYHFLRKWLIEHIVVEDQKYSEYLKPS